MIFIFYTHVYRMLTYYVISVNQTNFICYEKR